MITPDVGKTPFLIKSDTTEVSSIVSDSGVSAIMSIATTLATTSSEAHSHTISTSYSKSTQKDSVFTIPDNPIRIDDLCLRLRSHKNEGHLGYLPDEQGAYHVLQIPSVTPINAVEFDRIISLGSILEKKVTVVREGRPSILEMTRSTRMTLALTLAHSLLELYPTPWLPKYWSKLDVYFFQRRNGDVLTQSPFLLGEVMSTKEYFRSESPKRQESPHLSQDHSPALQSLGILIMELWFGRAIESNTFWQQFCGPDGREHEYTKFNAAAKWQKRTEEEGGLPLHEITQRCIFINFGVTTRDLRDKELVQAVHDGVVKELERLVGILWPD